MKNRALHLFIFISLIISLTIIPIKNDAIALFDPGSLATQVPNTVAAVTNKVTTYANKVIKITLQVYKSIEDFFKNLFSRKNTKIPGTKTIKESKIVDITDEAAVRDIFPTLFFRYPSNEPDDQLAYKHEGQEFFEDTIIEAFTAVRELEKKVTEIDMQIVTAEQNYTQAEDLNGGLYNKYMISATTDQVLIVIQELVAIKAQLTAAYAVHGEVEPLYISASTSETSANGENSEGTGLQETNKKQNKPEDYDLSDGKAVIDGQEYTYDKNTGTLVNSETGERMSSKELQAVMSSKNCPAGQEYKGSTSAGPICRPVTSTDEAPTEGTGAEEQEAACKAKGGTWVDAECVIPEEETPDEAPLPGTGFENVYNVDGGELEGVVVTAKDYSKEKQACQLKGGTWNSSTLSCKEKAFDEGLSGITSASQQEAASEEERKQEYQEAIQKLLKEGIEEVQKCNTEKNTCEQKIRQEIRESGNWNALDTKLKECSKAKQECLDANIKNRDETIAKLKQQYGQQ